MKKISYVVLALVALVVVGVALVHTENATDKPALPVEMPEDEIPEISGSNDEAKGEDISTQEVPAENTEIPAETPDVVAEEPNSEISDVPVQEDAPVQEDTPVSTPEPPREPAATPESNVDVNITGGGGEYDGPTEENLADSSTVPNDAPPPSSEEHDGPGYYDPVFGWIDDKPGYIYIPGFGYIEDSGNGGLDEHEPFPDQDFWDILNDPENEVIGH